MPKKANGQSAQESVRYQISLRDPKTNSFMRFFSHRKSEVIQAALEQYMRTDNRHTRELHTILGNQQADIDRLKYTLGDTVSAAPYPQQAIEIEQSPQKPDLSFDLSRVDDEEEIFGDIDI